MHLRTCLPVVPVRARREAVDCLYPHRPEGMELLNRGIERAKELAMQVVEQGGLALTRKQVQVRLGRGCAHAGGVPSSRAGDARCLAWLAAAGGAAYSKPLRWHQHCCCCCCCYAGEQAGWVLVP